MSGLPLLVAGKGLRVLIVGGGPVATRKAEQFVEAGADVRIVAPELCEPLEQLARSHALIVERRGYVTDDIDDAHMVVAATSDRAVNSQIARDCDAQCRLLNAADFSTEGNFATMAAHRRGLLTVGVSAGGVPAAATRIRDAIAERFDARYGDAVEALSALRRRLLAKGDSAGWRERSAELMDAGFCDAVESGALNEKIARWR